MSKLDRLLPDLYRRMHAEGAFQGDMWLSHLDAFRAFWDPANAPVVDFGCGPKGGMRQAMGRAVVPYDPYVAAFAADPWKASPRTFFSVDVLEHLPVDRLRELLAVIAGSTVRQVFVVVSCRAANRVMPNGLNAHLTVRHVFWWAGFFEYALGDRFTRVIARHDLDRSDCLFAFNRTEADE